MQQHTHLSAAAYVLANLPADPSVYRSQPDEDFDRNLETIMTLEEAEGKSRGELLASGTQAGDWDFTLVDEMHMPLSRKPAPIVLTPAEILNLSSGFISPLTVKHDPERAKVILGRMSEEHRKQVVANVNQRLVDSQKIGRPLRNMDNLPEFEYLSQEVDPYFHRKEQLVAQGLRYKPVELTMPTPKDVPITSSKQLFDDCPSVKDKWMRSPLELLGDHLQVLADATRDESLSTHEMTDYAKTHCGDLLENLNARLRTGNAVDWDQADYLTGRGFPVTFDKATGVLCIAINNSAIFVGHVPKKKESVLE